MGHRERASAGRTAGLASLALIACACVALASALLAPRASARRADAVEANDLLSCDDELPTQHEGLAWCTDGDSPMCIPALPAPVAPDLWDGQPAMAAAVPALEPLAFPQRRVRASFGRPPVEGAPQPGNRGRLERPPRV